MIPLKPTLFSLLTGGVLLGGKLSAAPIAKQEYDGTASASTGFAGDAFDQGDPAPNLTYLKLATAGMARVPKGAPQTSLKDGPRPSTGTYYISYLIDSTGAVGTGSDPSRKGVTLFASGYHDGEAPTDPGSQPNGAAGNTNDKGGGTEVVEWGARNGSIGYSVGNYGSAANRFQFVPSKMRESEGTHLYVIQVKTDAAGLSATLSFFYDPKTQAATPLQTVKLASFHLEQIRLYAFVGTFDEIRVGDTLADVLPGLPAR